VPGRRRTHRIPRGDVRAQKRRHIFAHQIAAVLARPSATPVLQSIRVPTLVLCGRADSRSPLAQHEQIAALVTGAHLEVVGSAGHVSTMEQPEAVAQALLAWLHRVEG